MVLLTLEGRARNRKGCSGPLKPIQESLLQRDEQGDDIFADEQNTDSQVATLS
jgi:hypothetical protein